METLAKAVQHAQATVLGVQDDLALLRSRVEADTATSTAAAAMSSSEVPALNPYYVDLLNAIQLKQEEAATQLQGCTHAFYEEFGALEAKAERLGNVREKEKELQSAKKSMQRYFDAHARELEKTQEDHEALLHIELEKREYLEEATAAMCRRQRQKHLAHHVILQWIRRAMVGNLAREYTTRQAATRGRYQEATCEAVVSQRESLVVQRAFGTWRSRLQARRTHRLEDAAAESEARARFFRQELAATQRALHQHLETALETEQHSVEVTAVTTAGRIARVSAEHEDELQRLRMAMEEMTAEFNDRTGTYIRQQEQFEQVFQTKEEKMRECIVALQTSLTVRQREHAALAAQQAAYATQVHAFWQQRQELWAAATERKAEVAHVVALGLVGRLRSRHQILQEEIANVTRELEVLAPLGERCLRLENDLANTRNQASKAKSTSRALECHMKRGEVVEELLTDRVAKCGSETLRRRYFARWMQFSGTIARQHAEAETQSLQKTLKAERQRGGLQQQEMVTLHHVEVTQLQEDLQHQRRMRVQLQAELEAATQVQREAEHHKEDQERRNTDLSAAVLRAKMECRGVYDKWWSSRAENLLLVEAHARCQLEAQQQHWRTSMRTREGRALAVWTTALQSDVTQMTAVCEGWQAHCEGLESTHAAASKSLTRKFAAALERAQLQSGTQAVWAAWRCWAAGRRDIAAQESNNEMARMELIARHGRELAQLHTRQDTLLHRRTTELSLEKSQLEMVYEQHSEGQRHTQQQELVALRHHHKEELGTIRQRYQEELAALHTSHAAALQEQRDVTEQAESQLQHVGLVIVEYCAQASYTRWRASALQRKAARCCQQQTTLATLGERWHRSYAQVLEEAWTAKAQLWTTVTVRYAQHQGATVKDTVVQLYMEREAVQAVQRQLQDEIISVKARLMETQSRQQRTLAQAEEAAAYATAVQQSALEEHQHDRTTLTCATRLAEWQAAAHQASSEHYTQLLRLFEEAVGALVEESVVVTQDMQERFTNAQQLQIATAAQLATAAQESEEREEAHAELMEKHESLQRFFDEGIAERAGLRQTLKELVADVERLHCEIALTRNPTFERASATEAERSEKDMSKAAGMERNFSEKQTASSAAASSDSGRSAPLEVSAMDLEGDQEQEDGEKIGEYHQQKSLSSPSMKASPSVALMEALRQLPLTATAVGHLSALCSITAGTAEDAHETAPLTEDFEALLADSFLPEDGASATDKATTLAVQDVCQLLEELRKVALRVVQQHTGDAARLTTQHGHAEETIITLRENISGLLEEQRDLAKEMKEELRHPAEPSEASRASSLERAETWQARLDEITSCYANVLGVFYGDIIRRQDTFYSVNAMLTEVDQFSSDLLRRFEENAAAMARLRADPGLADTGEAILSPSTPSTASAVASVPSPAPLRLSSNGPRPLPGVLYDANASFLPPSSVGGTGADSPAAQDKEHVASAMPTPEKQGLHDRVRQLERLLIDAKVQLAEVSSVAGGSFVYSLTQPSAQVQVLAAQDARDLAHLSLSESDLLRLYTATESTTRALTTAVRIAEKRLHETQTEMAQQLRTACVAVEEEMGRRHRVELERYEARIHALTASLAGSTQQQSRTQENYESRLAAQQQETAAAVARAAKETHSVRSRYAEEVEELSEQIRLLEAELDRIRSATQSAVREAVGRQTELLEEEHTQKLRQIEKTAARLETERALLADRLTAQEAAEERRVQQERSAVARLLRRVEELEEELEEKETITVASSSGEVNDLPDLRDCWLAYLMDAGGLLEESLVQMAYVFTDAVVSLLGKERESWETEGMQLRERLASLLAASTAPVQEKSVHTPIDTQNRSQRHSLNTARNHSGNQHTGGGNDSTLGLSLSPTPPISKRATSLTPRIDLPHRMLRRTTVRSSRPRATSTPMVRYSHDGVYSSSSPSSAAVSPTRTRSVSVDSLELSQSLLRYTKKLSDQRDRNTERLERANALAAEVDDLVQLGANFTRFAVKQGPASLIG